MSCESVKAGHYCRFLGIDVTVAAREPNVSARDSFEGQTAPVPYDCLDKQEPCYQHSCFFTTDGGEWPFDLPRARLEQQLMGGAGI